jgi:murein DD-endopeptidase MepM/ murein hydrolase activator NlpD
LAAAISSLSIYPAAPRPGDAVSAVIYSELEPISATFSGTPISIIQYKGNARAIFGIPASKNPGTYNLRINFKDGQSLISKVTVKPKNFPRIYLGIPEKLSITPENLVVKMAENNKAIDRAVKIPSAEIYFKAGFGLPLRDNRRITSVFGEVRITGKQEIRHNGVDFGAPLGAAVGAMNDGIVSRAYFDPIYGNSVLVDHGGGIISLYLHLDKILVKEGDRIKKGKPVGRVGQTGYAERPHLHLSTKISGVSVDPLSLVKIF